MAWTGVDYPAGGEARTVNGRRVIRSAGAIGSPAILLRSGVGPRDALAAHGVESTMHLPGVGANLIDRRTRG